MGLTILVALLAQKILQFLLRKS